MGWSCWGVTVLCKCIVYSSLMMYWTKPSRGLRNVWYLSKACRRAVSWWLLIAPKCECECDGLSLCVSPLIDWRPVEPASQQLLRQWRDELSQFWEVWRRLQWNKICVRSQKKLILRKLTNSLHGFIEDLCIMFGVEVDKRSNTASVRLWEEKNTDKFKKQTL